MARFNDLTGQKFGRLTVIKRVEDAITEKGNRFTQWLCNCDCGNNDVVVFGSALTRKKRPTLSCGCLQKDKVSGITQNTYEFSNDGYAIGYTGNTNKQFIFDADDYEKVSKYHWYEESNGYIRSSGKNKESKVLLHRLIMGFPENMGIDHINHNTFDNRKSNLRIATTSQNAMNRIKGSNNTSGMSGVVWVKSRNKWKSQIKFNGQLIFLGEYDKLEDAEKRRKQAEEEYFGKYSYDNSMKAVM